MKNIAFFDPNVQAYDSLIQGLLKAYEGKENMDGKHAIAPIMAIQHAGQVTFQTQTFHGFYEDAEVALILL